MGRGSRLLVGCCGLAALLLGLAAPAGATTVVEARYGFAFSLPAKWSQVPLSGPLIGKFVQLAAKNDPSLEKALGNEVQQATKEHLKFLAIGPVAGGFFPNVNIGVETSSSLAGSSAATLLPLLKVQLKQVLTSIGAKQLKVFTTKLRIGAALEANYALGLAGPPAHMVQGVQLYIFHSGRVYVVTFTAETQGQDVAVARVVEASWRWV